MQVIDKIGHSFAIALGINQALSMEVMQQKTEMNTRLLNQRVLLDVISRAEGPLKKCSKRACRGILIIHTIVLKDHPQYQVGSNSIVATKMRKFGFDEPEGFAWGHSEKYHMTNIIEPTTTGTSRHLLI